MNIMVRKLVEINTDPQRRCYNGCHAKSEVVWTGWELLMEITPERVEEKLKFWRDLNDYAVSQRGKVGTLSEFKVVQ